MISEGNLVRLVYPTYYFRNKISSLPEFLEKRFGGTARTILAFISALFVHIGMSLYAGHLFFMLFSASILSLLYLLIY